MFYFVHSYAATEVPASVSGAAASPPLAGWTRHGEDFLAVVEDGPLMATQFHPEKSSDAGAALLTNWLETLR
jgi:glutamine amidotransferase